MIKKGEMEQQYGPIMGGRELMLAMGFRTAGAFRLAQRKGAVHVKLIEIEGRAGKFAYTCDVEEWLISLGQKERKSI